MAPTAYVECMRRRKVREELIRSLLSLQCEQVRMSDGTLGGTTASHSCLLDA